MAAFDSLLTALGADKFAQLYQKWNDTMTALKGGLTGQILKGNGVGSSPTFGYPDMRFAFVNIGNWDMDANTSVTVDVGISKQYIRMINIIIFADGSTTNGVPLDCNQIFTSGTYPGGKPEIQGGIDWATIDAGSTTIMISRKTGGIFDSSDYNQVAGFNRGIITIGHVTP
jgi:hypothetical protein